MPKSIRYAFGEPIVELVRIEAPPSRFFSDLDLRRGVESVRRPLMDLQVPEHARDLSPAGFIFHLPRSGSTLVARMLATPASCACVVEPEALNALLSSPGAPAPFKPVWLRRLCQLYCAAYAQTCDHVFLKTSSWVVLREPVFAAAFPEVRGCFVHRDPIEILVQLLERPVGWMADHARSFILEENVAASVMSAMSIEEYCARALQRFCEAALRSAPRVQGVAYETITDALPELALRHFGVAVSEPERGAMLDLTRYDSEDWSLQRSHDPEREQHLAAATTPRLREVARRFAEAPRRRLLQLTES